MGNVCKHKFHDFLPKYTLTYKTQIYYNCITKYITLEECIVRKVLSLILAAALVVTLLPSVFAADAESVTYSFLSTAIDGSNKVNTATATYENTAEYGSAPWAYVNALYANNNTSYNYEKCYNWYGTETYKEPEQGDGGYVFKLKVENSGWYSAVLNHIEQKTSVNAKIYLVPVSAGIDLASASTLSQNIKSLSDDYYLGYAEGYAAKRAVKATALKYGYIDAGEYYLVVAPHGVDANYSEANALQSNGKYLYVFSIYSLVLNPTAPGAVSISASAAAINVGESTQAKVQLTVGEDVIETSEGITWSSENKYASVDENGKITGLKEGVAKIKATVDGVESEAVSVAIVNPNKDSYEYVMGGRVLNTVSDTTASGSKVNFPTELHNVEPSVSAPWRLVRIKNINSHQLYYAKTADTTYYGVVNSSVAKANVNSSFFAYGIYVPKAGTYDLTVNSIKNANYGKAKIYFAKYDDAINTADVPSESGPIKESSLVSEIAISDTADKNKEIGEVAVAEAGEYLLVIAPSDANEKDKPFYNYYGFKLTPAAEDADISDAFKTEDPVDTIYNPSVSSAGYNASEGTSAVEGITKELQADGSYKMYAPQTSGDAHFLYWAKGLSLNKKIVSYTNEFRYTPAGGDNNILIAVYDNSDSSVNKAEFYNANGQLIKIIEDTSSDKTVPTLPSMAGYGDASAWKQYNGETIAAEGAELIPTGTMIFVAQYALENPIDVTVSVVDGNGTATVPYGEKVACTADSSKGIFKWWTKEVNGAQEIVSLDEEYSFLAWEDCTVTAVYDTKKPIYTGNTMKIVMDRFFAGKTPAVMAEFIGFGSNTVEKGIMFNETKIAMTRPGNQFTVTGEVGDTFKGYAIIKDGNGYKLIVDGEVTISDR